MARMFDVDPWVVDPDLLNSKVQDKVNAVRGKMAGAVSAKTNADILAAQGPRTVITSESWSVEELQAMRQRMAKIYENLDSMNCCWEIAKHEVCGRNKLTSFFKRRIWELIKRMLKPMITGITFFNSSTTLTVSEMIKLQEMIVSAEERRQSK